MRPKVTLKLATSLDGRIATGAGESRWITGEAARHAVHLLRAAHDAVLVGIGTVLADDPMLDARLDPPPSQQPARVVLDSRLRLPPDSKLARSARTQRLYALTIDATADAATELAALDVMVRPAPAGAAGIDLEAALRLLWQEGVRRLLVEGGGAVAAGFLAADLVDSIEWFTAPILLGAEGRPAIGPLSLSRLADAPRFERAGFRVLGDDVQQTLIRRT